MDATFQRGTDFFFLVCLWFGFRAAQRALKSNQSQKTKNGRHKT
jgi:hypothetical protein